MSQPEDKGVQDTVVHTDGGAGVTGDVHAGTFIGRDQIIVISGYTADQLDQALERLVPLLRQRDVWLLIKGDGTQATLVVTGEDARATLSADAVVAMTARAAANESTYLASLLVDPRLRPWATQFVPLAGTLTVFEDPSSTLALHPEFSVLHVEGEGGRAESTGSDCRTSRPSRNDMTRLSSWATLARVRPPSCAS